MSTLTTASRSRLVRRAAAPLAWGLVGLVLASGLYLAVTESALKSEIRELAAATGGRLWAGLFGDFLLNPLFHVLIASILLLESLIPAVRKQPLLSKGLVTDVLWLLVSVLFALAAPVYVLVSQHLFDRYLDFLRIDVFLAWPSWARFVVALLVSDFVNYVAHVLRHKVRPFWYFHAIHHSQKELNVFTENRFHPLDTFINHLTTFIPLLMIETSATNIVVIFWLRFWHVRFYHANVKANFGILRYVFVTPQSHRIHHSTAVEHRDCNYGATFSIWDHLFGTQCRDYESYPECGVDDDDFPFEQDGRHPVLAIAAQLVYPFARLAGDARRLRARPHPPLGVER